MVDPVDSVTADCIDSEIGCLFNLDSDPCELEDVAPLFPALRDAMADSLDALTLTAIGSKSEDDDDLVFDSVSSPFMEYDDVRFENVLQTLFQSMAPKPGIEGVHFGGGSSSESGLTAGSLRYLSSNSSGLESAADIDPESESIVHRIMVFGMVLFGVMAVILICVFLQLGGKRKRARNGAGGPGDAASAPLLAPRQ